MKRLTVQLFSTKVLGLIPLLWIAACVGLADEANKGPRSVGYPFGGYLLEGSSLETSENLVLARATDPTHYALPELVGAIEDAAENVNRSFSGTKPLRVGDLSWPTGGKHPRHQSHRSGRDADLMFYVTDQNGKSVTGSAYAFDRFGIAARPAGAPPRYFDTERNWKLVRTLLADTRIRVQWIFVSKGLKSLLLEYAAVVERDLGLLKRARWVLHEPSNARSHNDHFHVRIACSTQQRIKGCKDVEPTWPWWGNEPNKSPVAALPATDQDLAASDIEG